VSNPWLVSPFVLSLLEYSIGYVCLDSEYLFVPLGPLYESIIWKLVGVHI